VQGLTVAAGYDPFPGQLHINDSGIQLDPEKQAAMPSGVGEIEEYEQQVDFESGENAIRTFLVPWSQADAFEEWVMGVEWNAATSSSAPTTPLAPPTVYGGGYPGQGSAAQAQLTQELQGNLVLAQQSVAAAQQAYNAAEAALLASNLPQGSPAYQALVNQVTAAENALTAAQAQETIAQNALSQPALSGVLVRVPPAQHPLKPWLYAVSCNFEKGLSVHTPRTDVTVLPFNPATYTLWDTGLYTTPANHPNVDATPAVAAALATISSLVAQITQLTSLPLNANAATLQAVFTLLYPAIQPGNFNAGVINVPNVEFQQWTDLVNATSQQQIGFYAQQTYASQVGSPLPVPGVAVRYQMGVQALQQQLAAARINLQAVRTQQATALTAALPRVVVPMIQFQQPSQSTGGQPFSDGLAKCRVAYRPRNYRVRSNLNMAALQAAMPPLGVGGVPGTTTVTELQRNVERRRTWTVKSFQLPNNHTLYYVGTPVQVPVGVQGLLPLEEWTYIWHDVPDVPAIAIAGCIGKVNIVPFDFINVNVPPLINLHAPQTMLCMNPEVEEIEPNCRGRVRHKITYKFIKNPKGWNNFVNAQGAFVPATFGGGAPDNVGGTNLFYKLVDMNQLFAQPAPVAYVTPQIG
jgi:hypothetical protein